MIEYINNRLNQYGLWCLTGRTQLGYPRQAAFLNGQPQTGGRSLDMCDEEAVIIGRALNTLDRDHRRLADMFYIKMRNCDVDTIAKSLRCCRQTIYNRLHRVHVVVMDELNMAE